MQNEFDISQASSPARKLALKLYALHEQDRRWLLDQLDASAQAEIMPLLNELQTLGVQVDLEDLQHMGKLNTASVERAATPEDVQLIDRASLSQIDIVFDSEPPVLLQRLQALRAWRWRSEDVWRQGPVQQGSTQQAGARHMTHAAQQALLKVVAAQLARQEAVFAIEPLRQAHVSDVPATDLLSRLKGWMPWAR